MTPPFIDLGVHHQPKGVSDRIAFGFTKMLRWTADTFFAERYGQEEPGQGVRIPLRLTQSDLAELVGASRERVNQVMVDFRQKGYLAVDSAHRILVHKAQELARLCR